MLAQDFSNMSAFYGLRLVDRSPTTNEIRSVIEAAMFGKAAQGIVAQLVYTCEPYYFSGRTMLKGGEII